MKSGFSNKGQATDSKLPTQMFCRYYKVKLLYCLKTVIKNNTQDRTIEQAQNGISTWNTRWQHLFHVKSTSPKCNQRENSVLCLLGK